MKIDLLYLAYNRLEFTKASLLKLIQNTDWKLVERLVVYDDGSTDGTLEFLRHSLAIVPVPVELRQSPNVGPVGVMNDFVNHGGADVFAKIDNDVMLPPHWLGDALTVMQDFDVDLLGIEAMTAASANARRGFLQARNIGGIGLMRRKVFANGLPQARGRFGFTEWQHERPQVRKGWIDPALPVCLLNLVPIEPWRSLSERYIAAEWQRDWPGYLPESRAHLWEWF